MESLLFSAGKLLWFGLDRLLQQGGVAAASPATVRGALLEEMCLKTVPWLVRLLEPNFCLAWELNLIDSVWLDKYLLTVLINYRKWRDFKF